MIRYIKDEPLIKRTIICITIIMISVYGAFIAFQMRQLNTIHKKQIETFQRVVGTVAKEYPEKEAEIVKSIFEVQQKDTQKLGADILKKYGYDIEVEMLNDNTFLDYRTGLVEMNIWIVVLILILNIILLFMVFRKVILYFNRVSGALDNFIKGDYRGDKYDLDKGVVSRVSNQLKQVGNSIALRHDKLMDEKENSQALVTDISHQLKTPLSSLKMCNSLLLEEELDDIERKEFLDSSRVSIGKLECLIDSLVNISRLEANMIKIKPVSCSVKNTLTSAINGVYMKALDKEIEIELDEFEDQLVPHDSKWTEEAIFNVLENGVKYTNVGGNIKINVSDTVNYIRISIKDNGVGINKIEFNDIFKRFYRGKTKDIKSVEGSGVGLYLTRKILEEQGGSVMVKSTFGIGSEFTILLRKQ
ncbi:MAG: HAMP domain-containing sensor histidine kinase [Clostridium sp.]|uniref:sensor histidine kinase n=1 Tax=Clostridium sp. TaxID=1506 RepID=UPI00304E02AD